MRFLAQSKVSGLPRSSGTRVKSSREALGTRSKDAGRLSRLVDKSPIEALTKGSFSERHIDAACMSLTGDSWVFASSVLMIMNIRSLLGGWLKKFTKGSSWKGEPIHETAFV
jgi:hypothetical protein